MAIRTTAQVTRSLNTAREYMDRFHRTEDGRVFKFWSLAPRRMIWLTDGREFMAYNPRENRPCKPYELMERTIADLDEDEAMRWKGRSLPIADDQGITHATRVVARKKWRAADGWHAN